jgi:pilus assembly protein CpaF
MLHGLGLGVLQSLFDDHTITEVMINGARPVWIERAGVLEQTDIELEPDAIERLIERVLGAVGRRVDRRAPFVDARLADGSRVNVIVPPVALDGPCVTIRRFAITAQPLAALVSPTIAALLTWAVHARLNIVVSGGAGAGKTTLLNALAGEIPPSQRVITVEDAAELRLPTAHVVRLEARPANAEGAGAVTIRDLVRNALRMRPDRIVVGEVRGAEALDMLQAMNTGHEGSLSTCHANSPVDALRRLETMVLLADASQSAAAVREQIVASIDLVVQVTRRSDGTREISEIAEVDSGDGLSTRAIAARGAVVAQPNRSSRVVGTPPPDAAWLGA